MTGVAEPLDELRIAIGEVDVLATLTTATYDSADWSEPDPTVVDGIARLLSLISKSATAARRGMARSRAGGQPRLAAVAC